MRVALLITELMRFQTRAILKDEVKGRMRKRVVFGFREVRVHECPQPLPVPASSSPRVRALTPSMKPPTQVAKAVYAKKARCVIMAPNIEQVEGEGGLDEQVTSLLEQAQAHDTRVLFALTRSKLGLLLGPKIRISVVVRP